MTTPPTPIVFPPVSIRWTDPNRLAIETADGQAHLLRDLIRAQRRVANVRWWRGGSSRATACGPIGEIGRKSVLYWRSSATAGYICRLKHR